MLTIATRLNECIDLFCRFDGDLGFPGGFIDPEDPSVVFGLNRELQEEICLELNKFSVTEEDFVCCIYSPATTANSSLEGRTGERSSSSRIERHFYAKEVSLEEFNEIEAQSRNARDFGYESLGQIRVPLQRCKRNGTRRFLAKYLNNKFPSVAVKPQLFWLLYSRQILDHEDLMDAFFGTLCQHDEPRL